MDSRPLCGIFELRLFQKVHPPSIMQFLVCCAPVHVFKSPINTKFPSALLIYSLATPSLHPSCLPACLSSFLFLSFLSFPYPSRALSLSLSVLGSFSFFFFFTLSLSPSQLRPRGHFNHDLLTLKYRGFLHRFVRASRFLQGP